MGFFEQLPLWLLAVVIFSLRVIDVSLGTMRVISVVHGRMPLAVCLGFFEILIWVTAVAQVVTHIRDYPWLALAYAGGFATGNGLGITLERKMALGSSIILMISRGDGQLVAHRLRQDGHRVTTVQGQGRDGSRTLLYVVTPRRKIRQIIEAARQVDPELFYVVDHCTEASFTSRHSPLAGWRSLIKRK